MNNTMNTQHITLEMDTKSSTQKLESSTDPNKHTHNHFSATDIDVIDGRVPNVRKATPEINDDEFDDRPTDIGPRVGVDDGLLPSDDNAVVTNNHPGKPSSRRPSFSFPGYNGPGFVNINGVDTPIPDINAYQHKKTLAQGMMDLALLSANANQLRYVIESYQRHPYYYPSLVFITLSILFQIAVGVGLILNSKYNVKNEREICRANKINNYTVIGIFIITVVNVFVSAFGVADPQSEKNA